MAKLRFFFILETLSLYMFLHHASGEEMTLDYRLEDCLWNGHFSKTPYESHFRNQISQEFAKLQIVTGLTRYHLSTFGYYPLTPTNNKAYIDFLVCSWLTYGYIKNGEIIYDSIEMALKEALVREVGGTGPGTNLSILQAKTIMNTCKTDSWRQLPLKVVNLQNCIHSQIKYLNALNA